MLIVPERGIVDDYVLEHISDVRIVVQDYDATAGSPVLAASELPERTGGSFIITPNREETQAYVIAPPAGTTAGVMRLFLDGDRWIVVDELLIGGAVDD